MTNFAKIPQLARGLVGVMRSLNEKAGALVEGSANEARLINEKCNAIIQAMDNQSGMINDKLNALIGGLDNQSRILNEKLGALIAILESNSQERGDKPAGALSDAIGGTKGGAGPVSSPIDPADAQRSHSGLQAGSLNSDNPVYIRIREIVDDGDPDTAWSAVLGDMLSEAKSVAHTALVLRRQEELERYLTELSKRHNAEYLSGEQGLEGALFHYWLVRTLKPQTIVQCGVGNGLSSAFVMLALVQNGPEGRLHLVGLPSVYDPKAPEWNISGKTYSATIPEGRTIGWMVPEAYRKRFNVLAGKPGLLLPELLNNVAPIQMFCATGSVADDEIGRQQNLIVDRIARGGLIVSNAGAGAIPKSIVNEDAIAIYNFKNSIRAAFL
jgi:hypothetical protein